MFSEINNQSLQEKIEDRKQCLRRLSQSILQAVLAPLSVEDRNQALVLQAHTHDLYQELERLESDVSSFTGRVDELLSEFIEMGLLINGELYLLKMKGNAPEAPFRDE